MLINGQDLYRCYDEFRSVLGYVPQDDVMHRSLTVRQALYYCARLRLPPDYSEADWTTRVAYVPQEPRLLHASVKDNIRFYREIDDAAIERAGRLARIHDDVMSWPEGYDTIIGPRADAVSGGQKQRVCLARALAAEPEVLVLDEPTSALDPHSETLIGTSLSTLRHQLTLFIVAHRMSTLDICDRVMVIVGGRVVAFDTKAELQRTSPYYRSASLIAAGGGRLT